MTKNRRRKADVRAQQVSMGSRYMAARREIAEPAPSPSAVAAAGHVERIDVHPPLSPWTRPIQCWWWAELEEQHGPLIAFTISKGDGWWGLDDLAREVVGALQEDLPASERGLWIDLGRYTVTKREHLEGIGAKLDGAGALSRLIVRSVPDAVNCMHASCQRRRSETPAVSAARRARAGGLAPRRSIAGHESGDGGAVGLQPASGLSLLQVMEKEPSLTSFGFGVFEQRYKSAEQRRHELHNGRDELRRQEGRVVQVRDWLVANVAPIKTPKVSSYGMKHVVEKAIGEYVTNGELIAAALMVGYPMGHQHGPNADFGMSKRDVDRARATG